MLFLADLIQHPLSYQKPTVLSGPTKTSLLSAPSTVSMFVPAQEEFIDEQPTTMSDRWMKQSTSYYLSFNMSSQCSINLVNIYVMPQVSGLCSRAGGI